jgi:hypothetical protein
MLESEQAPRGVKTIACRLDGGIPPDTRT